MTPTEGNSGPRHRRGGTGPGGGPPGRGRREDQPYYQAPPPERSYPGDDYLGDDEEPSSPASGPPPRDPGSYRHPTYRDSSYPDRSYRDPSQANASRPGPAYPGRAHPDTGYPGAEYPEDAYPASSYPDPPQAPYPAPFHQDPAYPDPGRPAAADGERYQRPPHREPTQSDGTRRSPRPSPAEDPWNAPRDAAAYRAGHPYSDVPRVDVAGVDVSGATQKLPAAPRLPPPSEGGPAPTGRDAAAWPPVVADPGRTTRLPTPPAPPDHVSHPDASHPDHAGYARNDAPRSREERAARARRGTGGERPPSLGEARPTVALPRSNVRPIPAEPDARSRDRDEARGRDAGTHRSLPGTGRDSRDRDGRPAQDTGWRQHPPADGPASYDVPGSRDRDVRNSRPRPPLPRGDRGSRARTGGQGASARGGGRRADSPPTAAIGASSQRARTAATTTQRGKATPAKAGPSLGQASGIMAIGTIASRASGFLRTVAIAAAIGTGAVGDAYNVANTTPNIIYDLLLGGILTSVVVPVMVRAAKEDPDGGDKFASSLLTLMILGLGVATAIGMIAAPLITNAYLNAGPQEQALATDLLRWFLPQIIFYGVGATIGAILNVRQSFAAPMFAPILNNVLVIATCVAFIYVVSGPRPPGVGGAKAITHTQTTVLAGGTTLGVVAMTLALLPALRRVGFRYRPTLDLRHPELRSAARLASWTLLFVVVSQAGYLVIVNLSTASTAYTIYTYGYQIFQLPYAIIGVSVITALLPRMSGHAAQGRADLVRADISTATRVAATAIVPAALFLLALGRPIAVAVFHHGAVNYHDAIDIGDTLSAFALALVPFSLFQVQLRAFYAYQDSRTPALVNMGVVAVNVLGAVVLTVTVPERHRAPALALAFAAAYLVGLAAATTLLRRRLGGVDGNRTARVITQVAIAAGLGAVVASLVARAIRALVGTGWLVSGIAVVLACTAGGALFLAAAVRMQIHEVSALLAAVNGRLGRGRRGAGGRPAPKPPQDSASADVARAATPQRPGGSARGDRTPGTERVDRRQPSGGRSRPDRPDRTERIDRGDRAQGRNRRSGPPPGSGRPDPRRGEDGTGRRGRRG